MEKKSIMIYSNMAPSKDIAYAGVFVVNQYDFLSKHYADKKFHILAMPKTFTGAFGSVIKYVKFFWKSFFTLLNRRIDIIHLHYFYPLAIVPWVAKKIFGTKIVVTVHGSDFYAKMSGSFSRWLYTRLLRDYDYVICVGEKLAFDFQSRLDIKPNRVLCAGVDRRVFHKKPDTAKVYDYLFVGTLIERKGIDILIKIIEETFDYNLKWCIIGAGEYSAKIEELKLRFPDNIDFYSKMDQQGLCTYYNKAKWFVFPSRNEPFGLVASECVFSGTPVICSTSGGLKEQVIDGYNGFLVSDVENVSTWTDLIAKTSHLSQLEYEAFQRNCTTSNSQFSLEYVCESINHIYDDLLNN